MADSAAPNLANEVRQITKDEVYDAVPPNDFSKMLDIDRHLNRSSAFDKIISATHDHFWDPLDKKYIDFTETPWDLDTMDIQPDDMVPALLTDYVQEHFEKHPEQRIRFKNEVARWSMSAILHGEQGALNLSASLCHVLRDLATIYQRWNDPLAKKLTQLVMTDEAFHHKFGKIWADRTIPKLSEEEHNIVEDWAAHCFQTLLFNLVAPHQMKDIYVRFGLDPDKVMEGFQKVATDEARREQMKESTNIFRVLVKTLWNAGIITSRTSSFYAMYVNFDEFKAEGEEMVGDAIALDGIKYLQTINFGANVNALDEVKAAAVAAE
jgi:hypothetical protein